MNGNGKDENTQQKPTDADVAERAHRLAEQLKAHIEQQAKADRESSKTPPDGEPPKHRPEKTPEEKGLALCAAERDLRKYIIEFMIMNGFGQRDGTTIMSLIVAQLFHGAALESFTRKLDLIARLEKFIEESTIE
jgi:hypothetical protein